MKFKFQRRLAALGLAVGVLGALSGVVTLTSQKPGRAGRGPALGWTVGLLGALIVAVTLTSQKQAEEARERLGQVDLESMRIPDRFKDKPRYANRSEERRVGKEGRC